MAPSTTSPAKTPMPFHEHYADVRSFQRAGVRGRVRSWALDGLAMRNRITAGHRALSMPRVQFLLIHHIFRDEEAKFRDLLEVLQQQHTFIPYSEGIRRITENDIDRPYICLTSDDGLKNNLKAAEIMEAFGIQGCFFVNPYTIGNASYTDLARFCAERLHFPPVEFMNWDDVRQLLKHGHEIGSHTMAHQKVTTMSPQTFREDCGRSFSILRGECGRVAHFAYPYGRFTDFKKEYTDFVFEAGFTSLASAERGCHINGQRTLAPHDLLVRRDHVVVDWKRGHILHFLINNARNARFEGNFGWG